MTRREFDLAVTLGRLRSARDVLAAAIPTGPGNLERRWRALLKRADRLLDRLEADAARATEDDTRSGGRS